MRALTNKKNDRKADPKAQQAEKAQCCAKVSAVVVGCHD